MVCTRLWPAWLLPLVVASLAAEATAQPQLFLDRRTSAKLPEEGINLEDCQEVEVWEFIYSCVTCTNVAFWIGDNCATAENRTGASPTCAELKAMERPSAAPQDLNVDAGQFVDPFDETHVECGPVDTTTTVFVLDLVDESDNSASFAEYVVSVDTDPPPPPIDVEAAPGEGSATVSWSVDEGTAVEDRFAFQALCSPTPRGGCTGGLAGGAEASSDCFCGGRQSTTARSVRIDGLDDGSTYQFAVIAYDDFENPSEVSEVAEATPQPVVDFFESYRAAGGQAGGGLCAVVPALAWSGRRSSPPPLVSLGLLLGASWLVRRRHR